MEYLGDLQICPILSFKTGSFTKQFITVLHSKSCWAESEPESFCPLSSCSALRGLCHCLSSKRGSLDNTYFLTFGLASHSSGAVSRIFCLFAIPSPYLNHIWQLFHLVAFEEQLHQSSFALWWPQCMQAYVKSLCMVSDCTVIVIQNTYFLATLFE